MGAPDFTGAVLLSDWCDLFGNGNMRGNEKVLGGLGSQQASTHWHCRNKSIGRFRMVCEHGHKGQVMKPCQTHYNEFNNQVKFCPRCNADSDHKCNLTMEPVT